MNNKDNNKPIDDLIREIEELERINDSDDNSDSLVDYDIDSIIKGSRTNPVFYD